MPLPLVSCLTATYGRFSVLRNAVTCFLDQTYQEKELLILNTNPVPIICDLPQVKVYNDTGFPTLGDCRNKLLQLAKGQFIRTWDDDDLYLPNAIEQGVNHIPEAALAWKPHLSWSWHPRKPSLTLNGNTYEASWTCRAQFVRLVKYLPNSGGNEHKPLKDALAGSGGISRADVGLDASYVYVWDSQRPHISSTLGGTISIEKRTLQWKNKNDDTGSEQPLSRSDLSNFWTFIEEKGKPQYVDSKS